jgi:hypothetical protein
MNIASNRNEEGAEVCVRVCVCACVRVCVCACVGVCGAVWGAVGAVLDSPLFAKMQTGVTCLLSGVSCLPRLYILFLM